MSCIHSWPLMTLSLLAAHYPTFSSKGGDPQLFTPAISWAKVYPPKKLECGFLHALKEAESPLVLLFWPLSYYENVGISLLGMVWHERNYNCCTWCWIELTLCISTFAKMGCLREVCAEVCSQNRRQTRKNARSRLPNQVVLALPLVALQVLLLRASPPRTCKWGYETF